MRKKRNAKKGSSNWQTETARFGNQMNEQIESIEATQRRIEEEER